MKLTDRLQGKSSGIRWVISAMIAGPQIAVRYALIGTVSVLWLVHAPRVISHVWSSVVIAKATPNKKRTPQNHQPWQRFDDVSDVRVRISELTQSPEQ